MRQALNHLNPFMMITDPETILQAMERSERLSGLKRRVCRPLDRPLIPKVVSADMAAYDHLVDLDEDHDDGDDGADLA